LQSLTAQPASTAITLIWDLGITKGIVTAITITESGPAGNRVVSPPSPGNTGTYTFSGLLSGTPYTYLLVANWQENEGGHEVLNSTALTAAATTTGVRMRVFPEYDPWLFLELDSWRSFVAALAVYGAAQDLPAHSRGLIRAEALRSMRATIDQQLEELEVPGADSGDS
jgi:hypothetical protein